MDFEHFLREANTKPDYNTNAGSYYKDLARKQHLIQLLAEKIWEYENTLNETLEQIEKRLTDYITENDLLMNERLENWDQRIDEMPEEMRSLFVTWLNDGTLEQIINHDVLGNKADKDYVDDLHENVTAKLTHIVSINEYPRLEGETTDTERVKRAIDDVALKGGVIDFPIGTFTFNETLTVPSVVGIRGVGKGRSLNRLGTVFQFSGMPLNQTAIKIGTGTTDHYGMMLENIMLLGEGSDYAGIGVELTDGSYNYQFNNVDIQHFQTAVRVDRSWDMTINLITVRHCKVGFEFYGVVTSMSMQSCVVYGAEYAYDFKVSSEIYYSSIMASGSDGSINVVRIRGKIAGLTFYNFDFESGTSGNQVMYGWDISGSSVALSIHGGKAQNAQMNPLGAVYKIDNCQSVDIYGARHDSTSAYAPVFKIDDTVRGKVRLFGGYYTGFLGDISKVNNVSSNGVAFKGLSRESIGENFFTSKGKSVVTSAGSSVQRVTIKLPTNRWFSGVVNIHGKDNGTNTTLSGGIINISANNVSGDIRPVGEVLTGDCTVTHTIDLTNSLVTFEITSVSNLTVFEFNLTLFGADTESWF